MDLEHQQPRITPPFSPRGIAYCLGIYAALVAGATGISGHSWLETDISVNVSAIRQLAASNARASLQSLQDGANSLAIQRWYPISRYEMWQSTQIRQPISQEGSPNEAAPEAVPAGSAPNGSGCGTRPEPPVDALDSALPQADLMALTRVSLAGAPSQPCGSLPPLASEWGGRHRPDAGEIAPLSILASGMSGTSSQSLACPSVRREARLGMVKAHMSPCRHGVPAPSDAGSQAVLTRGVLLIDGQQPYRFTAVLGLGTGNHYGEDDPRWESLPNVAAEDQVVAPSHYLVMIRCRHVKSARVRARGPGLSCDVRAARVPSHQPAAIPTGPRLTT